MDNQKALPNFNMAMIALLPDDSDRTFIRSQVFSAFEGTGVEFMNPEMYHITLANLGPLTMEDVENIQDEFRWIHPERISGKIGGAGYFTPEDEDSRVMILHFDSPRLGPVRESIVNQLDMMGITPTMDHGFTPHITIARGQDASPLSKLNFQNQTLIFNRLYLVVDNYKIPLGVSEEQHMVAESRMKSYELSPEGDLWIYVYGVPFRGPDFLNEKDLDQEYFSEKTDIGFLDEVFSYWDHGKISDDPVYRKVGEYFGNDPIGKAEKVAADDEGWIYRVIVDRRKKYFNLLKKLAEEHMLQASSTPFQRGVEKDADGHWNKWPVVEVALCVTPNNPNAKQVLAKTLDIGEDMGNKPKDQDQDLEKNAPDLESEEQKTEAPASEVEETLQDQMEKIFNEGEEEETEETESLAKAIENLTDVVNVLVNEVAEMKEKDGQIEKSINDVRLAFPALAQHIKDLVGSGVRRGSQSQAEKDAEEIVRQRFNSGNPNPAKTSVGYLPPDAPGL